MNVRQPGRAEEMGAEPRFALCAPEGDGRSNELVLWAVPRFCAGRAVLVGREVEFRAPRPANPFDAPLARDAVKNRCEFDGAFRYDAGSALRPLGL